jgi:hypothetical protein
MPTDPTPEQLLEQIRDETARLRLALAEAVFPLGVLAAAGSLGERRQREVNAVVRAARRALRPDTGRPTAGGPATGR